MNARRETDTPAGQREARSKSAVDVPPHDRDGAGAAQAETGAARESEAADHEPGAGQAERPRRRSVWRWIAVGAVITVGLIAAAVFGIPWYLNWLHTVSTDDAYVRGHITYVAARIESRVVDVPVDDNDFVTRGTLLARLDDEPYQVAAGQKRAALTAAQAQLAEALAQTRTQIVQAWADHYAYVAEQESVHAQIAALKEAVATWQLRQADVVYAEKQYERIRKLAETNAVAQDELDARTDALKVARQEVVATLETVHRIRAQLGLPAEAEDLTAVPAGLERDFAQVRAALARWELPLSQIGIPVDPRKATSDQLLGMLESAGGEGVAGKSIDELITQAPQVMLAQAEVEQAQHALDEAELQLGYTEIRAAFDGFVTERSVNPGNVVQPTQKLLGLRPRHVWVEANLKETQIDQVRIGQPVKLYVDAYPDRVFRGRVAGFSAGTGAAMSLLPPENATGNFVKVVQRLPVRIELSEPPPVETPLFVGLSVVPEIDITAKPTGPHAGERLRLPASYASKHQALLENP
jgi:membrane fusion protein (multidrug efflux system)